jgi:hypothetical protein
MGVNGVAAAQGKRGCGACNEPEAVQKEASIVCSAGACQAPQKQVCAALPSPDALRNMHVHMAAAGGRHILPPADSAMQAIHAGEMAAGLRTMQAVGGCSRKSC